MGSEKPEAEGEKPESKKAAKKEAKKAERAAKKAEHKANTTENVTEAAGGIILIKKIKCKMCISVKMTFRWENMGLSP